VRKGNKKEKKEIIKNRPMNLTFSMLYLERAIEAMSTASCCIGSDMSAFFITAFLCSAILKSMPKLPSRGYCSCVHKN